MDKKIVGLIAAVSGLGTFGAAQASTPPAADVERVMNPQSFAELLDPIPNAVALLRAAGEGRAAAPDTSNVQVAWHHHHHHHHHWYWHHHHHHHHHWYWHHHHHNWWWWHHHHHHHWY
jgi:hypothetical protein